MIHDIFSFRHFRGAFRFIGLATSRRHFQDDIGISFQGFSYIMMSLIFAHSISRHYISSGRACVHTMLTHHAGQFSTAGRTGRH